MALDKGHKLPKATLLQMGETGPEPVEITDLAGTGRAVIFALPGAFTGTCTSAHVPSFIRTRDGFAEKGVDRVICIAVNDPFVMAAWGKSTGATEAGITMLGDPAAEFTRAMGMNFSNPKVGFQDRSQRYAMVVEDGQIVTLHREDSPGACDISGGEALLATL